MGVQLTYIMIQDQQMVKKFITAQRLYSHFDTCTCTCTCVYSLLSSVHAPDFAHSLPSRSELGEINIMGVHLKYVMIKDQKE